MRDPLVLPFVAFAAGILAARALDYPAHEARLPVALFAGLLGFCLLCARRPADSRWHCRPAFSRLAVLALLAALGALDAAWQTPRAPEPAPVRLGEIQHVEGCLLDNGVYRDGLLRLKLEIEPGAGIYASVAPVRVLGRDQPLPALPIAGTRVALTGMVREPGAYRNPGSFDYSVYLTRQSIYWTLSAKGDTYQVLPGRCGPAWRAALGRIRQRGLDSLDRLYAGDDYARGMMRGLLMGDGSGIKDVWTNDWRRTGTYHALVISGSQITFVTMLLVIWLRFGRAGERTLLIAAAALGWGYALVCGASAPVVRAAAGFTFYAGARLLYRRPRMVNLLASVALCFVLISPDSLYDPSFQLTFLSVAAVGAVVLPLTARWLDPWRTALRTLAHPEALPKLDPASAGRCVELTTIATWLSDLFGCRLKGIVWTFRIAGTVVLEVMQLVLMSACVQWLLSMPMILYFHRVSITGLTANIIVIPLVSLAIPFGFAGIALHSRWLGLVGLWMLKGSQWAATTHARMEPPWRVADPPFALLLAFLLCVLLVCVALRRNARWTSAPACASFVVLALIVVHPFASDVKRNQFEVAAIDVGQGDSLLLGLPTGGAALVDTGGIQSFGPQRVRDSGFDIGEDVVSPYLWRRGVRRLDLLMISHAHADHAGGAPAILQNFHPREVWGAFDLGGKEWDRLAQQARAAGARVRSVHAGDRIELGGVHWEVFAPLPNLRPRDVNEASLVVRARYGRHAVLLTGDTDRRTEALILEAGFHPAADVLKVAHHGSKTSSLPRFLDAVQPALAMVSAGLDNHFGHPHPITLEALRERRAVLLRTDRQGLVDARWSERYLEVIGHDAGVGLPPAWGDN
jgi:competence protein ComEC